jgi:hypothetical protein
LIWQRLAWSESLGLLVAVAATGSPTGVMTSPDGITWTTRTATGQTGFHVAWSPTLHLFVIVAGTQTSTSPDGVTWTAHAAALPSANWRGLIWSDLGFFVALSDGSGATTIAVSSNGITWTLYPAPVLASGGRWALAWSPTLARLVAVGFTSTLAGTIMTNSAIVYRTLTGVPASGPGSILYTIQPGDQVNLRVVVDDVAAQAAIAALMLPLVDDGIIEGQVIQDGRISETEARARGLAQIELRKNLDVAVGFQTRDLNAHAGRTQGVNLTAPTSCVGDFKLQSVSISGFLPARWPIRQVQGSNRRFTLESLLRLARGGA